MMPRPGRPTPDLGLAAAGAQGIDLAAHRSTWFSPEEAARAGVVLIFDEINRQALHDRYPALPAPVLCLGDFADPPLPRIGDPVDGDRAVFDATYADIARAVDSLAAALRG
jgi:protein-tyrosine-phosphatase